MKCVLRMTPLMALATVAALAGCCSPSPLVCINFCATECQSTGQPIDPPDCQLIHFRQASGGLGGFTYTVWSPTPFSGTANCTGSGSGGYGFVSQGQSFTGSLDFDYCGGLNGTFKGAAPWVDCDEVSGTMREAECP